MQLWSLGLAAELGMLTSLAGAYGDLERAGQRGLAPAKKKKKKMERVTISTVQHSGKMLTFGKAEISHYFYSNAIVIANLVTHDRPETIIRQSFFSGKSPTASIHISHSICTNLYVRCCMGSRQRVVA